ncbi:MAG: folylpolyglutamate synthase/dihydrofolate synthase family protein [Bacteroidota bacterium]|nr:folylpolyglutamate synthase/dihydrofolate synthase family protein [Bacteroidota bacterium]
MTYQETIDFLYSKLPYFTRDGKAAIKKDLTNTIQLCEVLGNPHLKFKSIHIAGTNGKGSVSNMLSAIFQSNGYKTGLYTSPHLLDFRERIRINGEMVNQEFVIEFVEKIKPHLETIQPSFFEITVAMCFDYFAKNEIDIAIIETGLGGRLDSTNIINPLLSVITNIGYDHMDLLGNTLAEIAFEKAGIIKPNTTVVVGETHAETEQVFKNKAIESVSPISFADQNLDLLNYPLETDLKGSYQSKNILTILQVIQVLNQNLGFQLDNIQDALLNVKALTGFRGRWEILGQNPQIIADTGHNIDGLTLVFNQLQKEEFKTLHIVFGMVKDKDRSKILDLLPKDAQYYFCQPNLPRALDSEILLSECQQKGLAGKAFATVFDALNEAQKNADLNDLIFVGGSTFVVAEILT